MVTVEELKQKYPVRDVAPYGSCVVVPGSEFDPDWEAELGDQGFKVFLTSLDQRPISLVQVKKPASGTSLKGTEKDSVDRSGEAWTDEEDKLLLKRISEESGSLQEKISKIFFDFPGRTPVAIKLHYKKLKGKLKSPDVQVYQPKTRVGGRKWSPKEEDLLVELWNKGLRTPQIKSHFPGKSLSAVLNHLSQLQTCGRIKSRWRIKRKKEEEKEHPKKPEQSEKGKCPKCGLPTDLCACSEVEKELRRESPPVHAPTSTPEHMPTSAPKDTQKEELVCFESYCPKCHDRRSVQDSNTWTCCPVCGGPLIIWNVEIQEAS